MEHNMILDDIVAYKRLQINEEKRKQPQDGFKLEGIVSRDFKAALERNGMSIIAEIKKASPSKGIIKEDFDAVKIGKVYEEISIDAVSILTEKQFFKGEDSYIGEVKKINTKPILRKDFIIDEYQLFQAKAIKADAVLLIAAILGDKLERFYKTALKLGLSCLVEVHDERELDAALSCECDIIGINNRDLRDFSMNLKTTERLLKYIPKRKIVVSESGIKTPEDIRYLKSIGADAVLIGETFIRQMGDPQGMEQFVKAAKVDYLK